jgi:hypothetical protein
MTALRARFAPQQGEQVQRVRSPGSYTVAVREHGDRKMQLLDDTRTGWLETGETLGFRIDEDGHVRAFTRLSEHDLGVMPAERVKYLCWVSRQWTEADYDDSGIRINFVSHDDDCERSQEIRRQMQERKEEQSLRKLEPWRNTQLTR